MDYQALWLTLRLALSTTAVLLLIALPVAWWIASGTGAARALVQAVVALPLVLPPTVLGFSLLVGHPLAFSFSGLVVGSVLYSLPFAVQPLVAGFRAVDASLLEVAATLGASPLRAFRTIALPLAKPSLVTAAVLTFTHTVGEFGVVLMIGGNIPGATQTLSIVLYDQVQDFNYAAANRTAALLLTFSLVTLLLIYWRRSVDARSLLA